MKYLSRVRLVLVLFAFVLALSACATAATPAPTVVAVAPTATNAAPAPTDTPLPPTATAVPPTDTPVPPTATATLVPPTATATAVPPTPTATATSTPKPPPPTFTPVPAYFTVLWKPIMGYEPRDSNSSWCQFHNETQNLTSEEMPFQNADTVKKYAIGPFPGAVTAGYQPVFGIANADGTINRWWLAGWYAKAFGWPNGIDDFPPKPVAAKSSSGDWTWYSVTHPGESCRYVYVRWKGQVRAAEYSPKGDLINANATLPAGAP